MKGFQAQCRDSVGETNGCVWRGRFHEDLWTSPHELGPAELAQIEAEAHECLHGSGRVITVTEFGMEIS